MNCIKGFLAALESASATLDQYFFLFICLLLSVIYVFK